MPADLPATSRSKDREPRAVGISDRSVLVPSEELVGLGTQRDGVFQMASAAYCHRAVKLLYVDGV